MTAEHALEVRTLFRGVVIGTKYVVAPVRHSPVRSRRNARRCSFAIGSSAHADAPVAPAFLRHLAADPRGVTHPLIEPEPVATDDDAVYAITLAPGMTGTIYDGARTQALLTTPDGVTPGPRVALARNAHARLDCGAMTFLIAPAEQAAALPPTPFSLRAVENRYHLGTALGVALLLLVMLMIPSDPRALSLDILSSDRGLVKYLIKPPAPPPEMAVNGGAASGGEPASRGAKGPPGAAGSEKSQERNRRLAVKGDSTQIRVARAPEPIDPREAGMLGIFKRSSAMRAVLESETLGTASADVLGNLTTGPVGDAYGHGGLDSLGTGGGGSGTGEGTIGGSGHLNTLGFGTSGDGGGPGGYGHGVGTLGTHHARAPQMIQGILEVHGTLDREIVRRIIRRHINEVRFCYEQELVTHRNLGGRLVVQFSIAPTGQVLASVVQSSALANARVESCAVKAVRRWEFPRLDGGLTSVSYPFVFAPAGAE